MQGKIILRALPLTILLFASCGTVPKCSVVPGPAEQPLASVDDSLYANVLARAIATNGAVSYSELRSDTELTAYLQQISRVQTSAFVSRTELLAFWINTHNAYVLDMIRLNPARSIDDIPGFRYAKIIVTGDGQRYSLDDIEHGILEHQFREPRAFFALFDGTRTSPALRPAPYQGESLGDQLDQQLHQFLADSSKNYLDRPSNSLYLSKIFQDYHTTLEEMTSEKLPVFVRDFAPPAMAEWIARHPAVNLAFLTSDNNIFSNDFGQTPSSSNERSHTPPRKTSGGIR